MLELLKNQEKKESFLKNMQMFPGYAIEMLDEADQFGVYQLLFNDNHGFKCVSANLSDNQSVE